MNNLAAIDSQNTAIDAGMTEAHLHAQTVLRVSPAEPVFDDGIDHGHAWAMGMSVRHPNALLVAEPRTVPVTSTAQHDDAHYA